MQDDSVYGGLVFEVFNNLLELGINQSELENLSGVKISDFKNPDERIPLFVVKKLFEAGISLSHDPALALKVGNRLNPNNMGVVGNIAMESKTLRDAFLQWKRYGAIISEWNIIDYQMEEYQDDFILLFDFPDYYTIHITEKAIAATAKFCGLYSHDGIKPIEVWFKHSPPAYHEQYTTVFSCKVKFNQRGNALVIKRAAAQKEYKHGNSYILKILHKHAEELETTLASSNEFGNQVKKIIVNAMPEGKVDSNYVASQLNMSRSTLYRKLKDENTSFQSIFDGVRKQLALTYMEEDRMSFSEIAFLLGFSEPSAFNHAFKRWAGKNPGLIKKEEMAQSSEMTKS